MICLLVVACSECEILKTKNGWKEYETEKKNANNMNDNKVGILLNKYE